MRDSLSAFAEPRVTSGFGVLDIDGRAPCRMVLHTGFSAGRAYTLLEGRNIIGRGTDARVLVSQPSLSRHHAEIEIDGNTARLRDLGSINGTFRNDVPVRGSDLLADGDTVRVGSVELKFYQRCEIDALRVDDLYRSAMVDPETGAYNRRWFSEALPTEFALARRGGWPLSMIGLDLDGFKAVADRFGPAATHAVLESCIAAVQAIVGEAGLLARVGFDEFAILLPRADTADAHAIAERIRAAVERVRVAIPDGHAGAAGDIELRQTASLGVAELSAAMRQADDLAVKVDHLLYLAKQGGRNRVAD